MAEINPFQGPANYAAGVKNPFESAIGVMKLGMTLDELQANQLAKQQEQVAKQQEMQKMQEYNLAVSEFFQRKPGDQTVSDLNKIIALAPNKNLAEALFKAQQNVSKEQDAQDKKRAAQLLLAIGTNPAVAMQMLEDEKNVRKDPAELRRVQQMIDGLVADPVKGGNEIQFYFASVFGKDWYEGVVSARNEIRARAKDPFELEIKKADAKVATGTVESRIAEAAEKAKPAAGFAIIPEAERVSLGLPAGVYQRNLVTNKIEPVSKELVKIDMGQKREILALKELDVPRAQEFSAAAASARSLAQDSRVINDLLKGKGGGARIQLTAAFAKTLGFENPTVIANDLANSLAIRGATKLRPPGSGSTSDTEFKAFVSAFPSLANSEGGRELMANYADAFATRSAKLADHARKLIREDKYSEEEIAKFDTSLGPILKDDFYKRPGTGAPVIITLPNGQRARFPNQQAADAFKQRAGIQ